MKEEHTYDTHGKLSPTVPETLKPITTVEELAQVTGADGPDRCHQDGLTTHKWVFTGRTRPGTIFGNLWPDYEKRCEYCHETRWFWRK